MSIADLAAILPLLNQFAPEIKSFLQMLQSTPEEKHQEIMNKVMIAFNEVKNNGRPGDL